jgi:MATE family multidrug resistance protein
MQAKSTIRRLKRWVAPALRFFAGSRDAAAEAGQRPNDMVRGVSPLREVFDLAWPIAAAMIGETAIGLVDTKLVGGLGAAALGAVGISTTLMFLCYALVFGLARGVKVRTAHAVGAGTPEDGERFALSGVVIAGFIGLAVFAVSRDIGWALRFLGVDPELHEPARQFCAAYTYGAPATCILAALIQHRQGLGDTRVPMVVGIGGNVVNAFLAYGLIYGHFGLPALGIRGGGLGTALTEWIEMAVMLGLLFRDRGKSGTRERAPIPFAKAFRDVAEIGVPTGLQFGAEMLAFTTFTAILGAIGGSEIAGHQVALAIVRVSFLPGIAVGEAASVLVGRSLGQRNLGAADQFTRASIVVGVSFMALCGLGFAFLGSLLAHAFTDDPGVARVATKLLLIAAVFQVLDAVNIILRGALRGAKDVRAVAIIGILVVWICVPGSAFVLGRHFGLGAAGGWYGFVLETTFSALFFWRRWKGGAWRRDYPAPTGESLPPTALGSTVAAG